MQTTDLCSWTSRSICHVWCPAAESYLKCSNQTLYAVPIFLSAHYVGFMSIVILIDLCSKRGISINVYELFSITFSIAKYSSWCEYSTYKIISFYVNILILLLVCFFFCSLLIKQCEQSSLYPSVWRFVYLSREI